MVRRLFASHLHGGARRLRSGVPFVSTVGFIERAHARKAPFFLYYAEYAVHADLDVFWHYPANTAPWPERAGGVCRDGDFKLIEVYHDGHFEMFNIKKDRDETQNLIAAMPEEFAEMKAKLLDWQKSLGIEVPKPEGNEAVK
jgi:hypothetical protein